MLPVVVPGNEQNLDLARVFQRAGWTVITFHYRGTWGTPGTFAFRTAVEDADALYLRLQQQEFARAWGVDAHRIVIAGHSLGGYVAARIAASHPGILGAALIAPWDISYDARAWSALSPQRLAAAGAANFDDVAGRMGSSTPASLTRDVMREGPALDLTALAAPLASRRLLIFTETRDDPDDRAVALLAKLKRRHGPLFASPQLVADHGFNDHRIGSKSCCSTGSRAYRARRRCAEALRRDGCSVHPGDRRVDIAVAGCDVFGRFRAEIDDRDDLIVGLESEKRFDRGAVHDLAGLPRRAEALRMRGEKQILHRGRRCRQVFFGAHPIGVGGRAHNDHRRGAQELLCFARFDRRARRLVRIDRGRGGFAPHRAEAFARTAGQHRKLPGLRELVIRRPGCGFDQFANRFARHVARALADRTAIANCL
jgi:acetyl esterase/lipase